MGRAATVGETTTLSTMVTAVLPVMGHLTPMYISKGTQHCKESRPILPSSLGRLLTAVHRSIAHGVLASLAFVVLFPIGSILIRLASFRGLWLIHGLFQIFAFVVYIAAFALGIWMTQQAPSQANLIGHYHPIIGIVLFIVLLIQPVLGLVHHFQFMKHGTRTFCSYGHLWLGRLLITLGIINGGLGLLLARQSGYGRPTTGQIIAYSVIAGVMWLLWVVSSIVGEKKRAAANHRVTMGGYKEQYA